MPINSTVSIRQVEQEEFSHLDYQVMRHAFDSHNELGRLCAEVIYQNDLAARLAAIGLGPIRTEVPVTVSYQDFAKTYYLDLVVGDAAIYELKTVTCLAGEHDSQLLNYLFLHGSHHGKLINFRPPQVESRFINTGITRKSRRRLTLNTQRWWEEHEGGKALREILTALLNDWGGFLEIPLYTEAIVHFLGGEDRVEQTVPFARGEVSLGTQRFHLVAPEIAFQLTALTEAAGGAAYERQLRSLLSHTSLRAIQWINMAHHEIAFVTVAK
jgi:GxxExxY protein